MPLDLEGVIKQLAESSIIAQGKLEKFIPPNAHPKSVDELVAELVKSQELTTFQATQVKAGRAKALLLGEYTILDKIGAGGMGQVFKAQHRRMKRLVAVKMLPPAMTRDGAAAARFQREVEAAAKLSHPNIVAAHDAGQVGAAHFLVMEYVEGKDLSATVKKDGPLPVNKAVHYILQAARGLEFAHRKGVVHRDIKPGNLLLDSEGVVKILDMGLARIDSDGPAQTDLTGTGTIMGTVDYMSPEQALNTKDADARADIYSLGMSLYFLLAGKAAYSGETAMQKLMAHQNQPIPSLQDVQATVSTQLEAVFEKMVAKRIEDRYQTMSEVIEALEGLGFGNSTTAGKGDLASTMALSFADRKKLKAAKKRSGSLTEVVVSEKSKHLFAKIVGGAFAPIIAPILVTYLIKHLEKKDGPSPPPTVVAANATPKPTPAVVSPVQPATPPPRLVAPFDATQARAGQQAWAKYLGTTVAQKNTVGMTLVLIPPGEFLMGSTPEQNALGRKIAEDSKLAPSDGAWARLKEEGPQHRVAITEPYWLGLTEVTVGQFKKFVEATKYVTEAEQFGFGNSSATKVDDKITPEMKKMTWRAPGYAVTDDSPVTQVTWNDCIVFCNWLSVQEKLEPCYRHDPQGVWFPLLRGAGYRLPTEAEWGYACRAGTTTQFSFGDDPAMLGIYGWFNKNAGGSARAVGLKVANGFGLFDMHGNVYEWCQDFYAADYYSKSSPNDPIGPSSGSNRVLRGGIWLSNPVYCRSAYRNSYAPANRISSHGFRMVRVR